MSNPHLRSGALMVAASALLFSSKGVVVKCVYPYGVDAATLLALRMGMALPFFLAIAWQQGRGRPPLPARTRAGILGIGVLGYYVSSLLDFEGLAFIGVGLERTVLYLYPTLVVVLGACLERTAVTRGTVLALIATYVGIVLTCGGGGGGGPHAWLGVALVATSALTYAVFVLGSARMMRAVGSLRFTAIAISGACVATLTHFLATHPGESLTAPPAVLAYGAYLAVAATVAPALLMGEGMQRVGAQRFALIGAIGPVMTVILAWIILHETPTMIAIVGMAITIVAGAAMAFVRVGPQQRDSGVMRPAPSPRGSSGARTG